MPALTPLALDTVCRLPSPGDNCAIATRRLEAGTVLAFADGPRALPHTVLEGHRFAVQPITRGEYLLSWGLPFGRALAPIATGDYVANQSMLDGLAIRRVEGAVFPTQGNFADHLTVFELNENTFTPGPETRSQGSVLPPGERHFLGYRRPGNRGVGTRNFVVVIGTTSRTASFARQLVARLQPLARVHPGIDGIVAIAHTEGGGTQEPNNTLEILRALSGFMVHANVAAVLAVDYGVEPITNARLARFLREHRYPIEHVPHAFLTLDRGLAAGLAEGERLVREWLPAAHGAWRTPEPLSELRVALQCGGSDAFSGVSGNPLAGALVHELICRGGTGVLTETDEIMGAESYIFRNVRDFATARALDGVLHRFREKMAWHGLTAESNPSAGNRFRGLYNIAIKSLGAVHKKDPRTRLDTVIEYAQPLRELTAPGFTFMNGPGNDLEGVAGQVAAGCNLIIFVTGNGSITNFPFVPTLKITTTTRRHQLLVHEMDINAGRYLDGEPFPALTAESFNVLLATASGQKTKGEHAGHSQVSLWRNWAQTDTSQLAALHTRQAPSGEPLVSANISSTPDSSSAGRRVATERVALVLPTSMCSTQIARLAVERLNAKRVGEAAGISRFVTFGHSEGCGFGGDTMYRLLERTYRGYVTHPNVTAALLLEHGCEKLPNDVMRRQLEAANVPLDRFGWASVQLDGGIEKAITKVESWFVERLGSAFAAPAADVHIAGAPLAPDGTRSVDLSVKGSWRGLTIALLTAARVRDDTAAAFAHIAQEALSNGSTILLAESDPLLASAVFTQALLGGRTPRATLPYGEPVARPGLHIVASETDHFVENLTGFGANGAHAALAVVAGHAQQGHPLVPLLQFAEAGERGRMPADDIDGFLSGDTAADANTLRAALGSVVMRARAPAANAAGFVDFQLTRGLLGLTT
jgi:altronate dehydratase